MGAARRVNFGIGLLVVSLVAFAATDSIGAQDRSTVIRVLQEGTDFRARVRAAGALGSSGDPHMADALARALGHDDNAAVRAACAEGLGRLGVASSRSALERATRDESSSVRDAATRALRTMIASAPPAAHAPAPPPIPAPSGGSVSGGSVDWSHMSYVVFLGALSDRSGFAHARLVSVMSTEVRRALGGVHGVAVFSTSDPRTEADRECAARHLPQFRLEGSIARVQPQTSGRDLRVPAPYRSAVHQRRRSARTDRLCRRGPRRGSPSGSGRENGGGETGRARVPGGG